MMKKDVDAAREMIAADKLGHPPPHGVGAPSPLQPSWFDDAREKVTTDLHTAVTPAWLEAGKAPSASNVVPSPTDMGPTPLQPSWLEAGKGPSASTAVQSPLGVVHTGAHPETDTSTSTVPDWLKADPVPAKSLANTPRGRSRAFTTDSRACPPAQPPASPPPPPR